MGKRPINPADLDEPVGFTHGWLVESPGLSTLYLAGECAYDKDGNLQGKGDLALQLECAMNNIGAVLRDAGMEFSDLVQLNFYVLSRDDYATARREFGHIWRAVCAKHFPAMAMFQVGALYDPDALIEIQGVASRAAE